MEDQHKKDAIRRGIASVIVVGDVISLPICG